MDERIQPNKRDRGIALLFVCFALLLLSVIGLGMMYSANMETAINANYRDKQSALYAAIAGLQEARERIRYPYDITPPSIMPSLGAANVIYIVANSNVTPWDSTNASGYFDTELCQEHILNLHGTPGVPCPGPYSTATPLWYQVFNDSTTYASGTSWNLTNPLDLKWVRIALKSNNMTPVPVNGDITNGDQACWDGAHQISTPSTYTAGCQPIGGVVSVTVVTTGGGYTSTGPQIMFTGGGGSGASATPNMVAQTTGVVASITVTTGGSGYTSIPTVIISNPITGVTATAVATTSSTPTASVTGGIVTGVTLSAGGSYNSMANPPTITFTPVNGGSGASATAVLTTSSSGNSVGSVTLTNVGSNYTSPPTVSFTTGGNGAAATVSLNTSGPASIASIDVSQGDYCYTGSDLPVITITGTATTSATVTANLEGSMKCIHNVTVNTSPKCGSKLISPTYVPPDQKSNVTLSVGDSSFYGTLYVSTGGSPADDKTPSSFSVQAPGYNAAYTGNPLSNAPIKLTTGAFSDCSNVTVNAYAGYRLSSITVSNHGSYTTAPSVKVTGGIGTTAPTLTPHFGYGLGTVTVTAGGNYGNAPNVTFTPTDGNGSGATGTANLNDVFVVSSVIPGATGSGYLAAPTVTFNCTSPCSGSGATGTAIWNPQTTNTYSVASINLSNPNMGGSGYDPSSPPTVTISGGGGSGATAIAVMTTANTGTYYVYSVTVNTAVNGFSGSGYTSNPTVTFCGTDTAGVNGCPTTGLQGAGATGTAQVSGGNKFGQVYVLTAFAQTKTGARAMVQQEMATPVLGFALGGALTLDGPNPILGQLASSQNFVISGTDANSCNEAQQPDHPAVDGYDDPNANPPTQSVTDITNALPRPGNITGQGGCSTCSPPVPSVQNGFASLGETMTTTDGLYGLLGALQMSATQYYTNSTVGSFNPLTTTKTSVTFVDGSVTLGHSGQNNNSCAVPSGYTNKDAGCGILVVTGTLSMDGNFSWYGLILVVGDGVMSYSGGGNGNIVGSILESTIWSNSITNACPGPGNVDPAQGTRYLCNQIQSPSMTWNGGGGNGIKYDHCWSTDLMSGVPFTPPPSTRPGKILSFRILPY